MPIESEKWEPVHDKVRLYWDSGGWLHCLCGNELGILADDEPSTCKKCGRMYRWTTRLEMKLPEKGYSP